MQLIEMKNVSKSYQRGSTLGKQYQTQVLQSVNLKIAPGRCVGLLGRSGAGKSTLGRIALGLETPDSGTVSYAGKDISTLNKREYREFRRNVQVVFQNSLGSVNGRWTAFDIIAEPLRNFSPHRNSHLKSKVEDLLQQVGLDPADAAKRPHQFSGGELQRICIARAIALNPKLIVLDEAVSSLDMLIQARIVTLLQQLQESLKIAFLFISHDIRVVLRTADSLAIMHAGKIVEQTDNIEQVDRLSNPAFNNLLRAVLPPVTIRGSENELHDSQQSASKIRS